MISALYMNMIQWRVQPPEYTAFLPCFHKYTYRQCLTSVYLPYTTTHYTLRKLSSLLFDLDTFLTLLSRHLSSMCQQRTRRYTCGCEKPEEFVQCQQYANTNIRCVKPVKMALAESPHHCKAHMVKAGTQDTMHR